jgi:hypothetical protein
MRALLKHTCSQTRTASLPEIINDTPRPLVVFQHHAPVFHSILVDFKPRLATILGGNPVSYDNVKMVIDKLSCGRI